VSSLGLRISKGLKPCNLPGNGKGYEASYGPRVSLLQCSNILLGKVGLEAPLHCLAVETYIAQPATIQRLGLPPFLKLS